MENRGRLAFSASLDGAGAGDYLNPRMVAVAQLVEHRVVVAAVAGSSPVSHPIFLIRFSYPAAGQPGSAFLFFFVLLAVFLGLFLLFQARREFRLEQKQNYYAGNKQNRAGAGKYGQGDTG